MYTSRLSSREAGLETRAQEAYSIIYCLACVSVYNMYIYAMWHMKRDIYVTAMPLNAILYFVLIPNNKMKRV